MTTSNRFLQNIRTGASNRNLVYGLLIFSALIFFEIFNFSTTDYALHDLLGELRFFGIQWSTTLSIAFCIIDFAGIARIFTPETGKDEPKEVWYLFGAWILAATMNASLTWWGVSMAIANHAVASTAIVKAETIIKIVPIFVAILVWVIRVLIIGTLSVTGEKLLTLQSRPSQTSRNQRNLQTTHPIASSYPRSTVKSEFSQANPMTARPTRTARTNTVSMSAPRRSTIEPTYHTFSGLDGSPADNDDTETNNQNNSQAAGGRLFY